MNYKQGTITLTEDEWFNIQEDLQELQHLREQAKQRANADREYLSWSLGGGMVEAIFAGMELASTDSTPAHESRP